MAEMEAARQRILGKIINSKKPVLFWELCDIAGNDTDRILCELVLMGAVFRNNKGGFLV